MKAHFTDNKGFTKEIYLNEVVREFRTPVFRGQAQWTTWSVDGVKIEPCTDQVTFRLEQQVQAPQATLDFLDDFDEVRAWYREV
ncbi:MAG: hypothetical protein E4G90_11645 [Gemmatimonadales bacterium]|nr:MAG: hypothetical protein E4G90_11645 [Gemmatimonadales bacterium]